MVPKQAVAMGLKYFNLKNLKGRPAIGSQSEFDEMIQIWADDLTDISPEIFVAACKSLSGELTFYPSFSEVRRRCLELMHGKPKQALEVWAEIKRVMSAVCHPYANREDKAAALEGIACPVAREAAAKFDWHAFGLSDEADESYHKGQFEKLYNSVRGRTGIQREAERFGLPEPGGVKELVGGVVKRIGEV